MSEAELAGQMRVLEERLLDPAVRASPEELDHLLADDFLEFGASGSTLDKAQVIRSLQEDSGVRFSIHDFRTRRLGSGVVLTTYCIVARKADLELRRSLRSSIWVRQGDRWQIAFHQGTVTGRRAH